MHVPNCDWLKKDGHNGEWWRGESGRWEERNRGREGERGGKKRGGAEDSSE